MTGFIRLDPKDLRRLERKIKNIQDLQSTRKAISSNAIRFQDVLTKILNFGPLRTGTLRPDGVRSAAPGEPIKTDDGNTVQSITVQFRDEGFVALIGTDVEHAIRHELGRNRDGRPRPFIQPTFNKNVDKIRKGIAAGVQKDIDRQKRK